MSGLDWQWANDEHTEAHADRWVARQSPVSSWWVTHTDFPGYGGLAPFNLEPTNSRVTFYQVRRQWRAALESFLAWHATQPIPVPPIGQWIRATTADGRVHEFEVTHHEWIADMQGEPGAVRIAPDVNRQVFYIRLSEHVSSRPTHHVTEWTAIDFPQPLEPTEFGALVRVKGVEYVRAYRTSYEPWWTDNDAVARRRANWAGLTDRGPVEVLR